jgi:hypothetical protein
MSNSTSTPPDENSSPFSFEEYDTLIVRIEMLYALARKLSDSTKDQPCEYLIQQALMAFAKTVMSLLGFLRFIPSSRFHAKEREIVIDLSSASVMARQVMEDTLSFFYLSERNPNAGRKAISQRCLAFSWRNGVDRVNPLCHCVEFRSYVSSRRRA